MQTTITEDLTIDAMAEYRLARLRVECLDVSANSDAWSEVLCRLERMQDPLYVVAAYGVYVAGMPFLAERYFLTAEGLELDQADPSDWRIYTNLDKAHEAAAETLGGAQRPRQVSVVTITH